MKKSIKEWELYLDGTEFGLFSVVFFPPNSILDRGSIVVQQSPSTAVLESGCREIPCFIVTSYRRIPFGYRNIVVA